MADAQTDSVARTDFAAAAEWNRDMGKWRGLWRQLGIARAPIPAPMQELVAMFLSGEGAHLSLSFDSRDAAKQPCRILYVGAHMSQLPEVSELALALVRKHTQILECAK